MPLHDGHIANWALMWYYVIIHFMAAGFCYLFCRDLACSRAASLAAGLIFSLSGYIGTVGWPQMINGAVWIPLVFLFQLRCFDSIPPSWSWWGRRFRLPTNFFTPSGKSDPAISLGETTPNRNSDGEEVVVAAAATYLPPKRDAVAPRAIAANAALSGMFLGVAFLSGHHQVPLFTTVTWAGVWIYFLAKNRRLLPFAALALIIAGLTSALQTLPAYEYGHLAKRWVGAPDAITWKQPVPYAVHAHYGLGPITLFGIVFPSLHTNFDPFIGVAAFSLALLAVAALWRDLRVRLLAALGLGALLYSLANNSVAQGVLYALIPELDKARTPSAIVVLFQFAAAALAAFAIDELPAAWKPRYTWMLAGRLRCDYAGPNRARDLH
jgi:hypothetical protein